MTALPKETLLVVDDTPTNLQVMAECLASTGYRLLVAEDGPSAVALARQARPDLILLDIMMPRMDGYETCRLLKDHATTQHIPILFMTARTDLEAKVKGFQMGAVDYITKPYQEEEVLARINAHLTISRQKHALEQMLEERNRFMKIAAHDLRNPLTAIMAWSEFGAQTTPSSEVADMFRQVQASAAQMNDIINDFLALQILKARDGEKPAVVFHLRDLTTRVLEQHNLAAAKKGIRLTFLPPADPAAVSGNMAHTHQILSNYLSNAIKFSPLQTQTSVALERRGDRWRAQVADQGPGVPLAERHKIFQEFPKISIRPTGGEHSTGLGLAIVKGLAEAQGGSVGVDFPPTGGSVFWVEIPAAPAAPA